MEYAQKESCLTPYQLERIEKALVAAERLKSYLERGKQHENTLAYYETNLQRAEELWEEIARQVRSGAVDDSCQQYMADSFFTLRNGRICIPLQFEAGTEAGGVIITGPNTGGKTVSVKTVALNCMMAQMGLHVTCEKVDVCMNSRYLCNIGDGQSLTENLSRFLARQEKAAHFILHRNWECLP